MTWLACETADHPFELIDGRGSYRQSSINPFLNQIKHMNWTWCRESTQTHTETCKSSGSASETARV